MVPLQLFIGVGTVVNMLAVVLGAGAGMWLGDRFNERTRQSITDVLGLMTLVIGALSLRPLVEPTLSAAVGSYALIVIMIGLLIGTLIGSALRLEDRVEQLGAWLRRSLSRNRKGHGGAGESQRRFIDGFVTATLLFCIGPMSILGALSDGLGRGAEQLFIKSVLDGFAALAFASSFGIGVMFSALGVGIYQGALTLLGWALGDVLPPAEIDALSVAGGVILIGLAIRLIGLKQIRVAEMVPALVVAPLGIWLTSLLLH